MIHLEVGGASHVGRLRTQNQDCAYLSPRLVALADGMGGPPAGDVASQLAIEALRDAMADPDIPTLGDAVEAANTLVWNRGAAREYRGMGTTLCALALVDDGSDGGPGLLDLANVGDSRIYRLRDGHLELLTQDHSLVEEMVREGQLTAEQARLSGHRNIVTRAIGIYETVEIDTWNFEPRPGDRYLLCSDGLFNEVPESRIASGLRAYADPTETAHHLVDLANRGGGRDNITCVVVDVVEGPEPAGRSLLGDERILVPRPDTVTDLAGFTIASGTRTPATASGGEPAPDDEPDEDLVDEPVAGRSMLPDDEVEPPIRPRLVTWRTAAFLLAFVGVFVVAALAVAWYGRSGYFIDVDPDGEIAVYQGRPGGLLWFEPTLVESTGVDVDELTPVLREAVERRPEFASFEDATRYLANLADQLQRSTTTTTTPRPTSTTTTTRPRASATAPPGGSAGTGTSEP
jgi:serine/threonine protein phosphatase PrpC